MGDDLRGTGASEEDGTSWVRQGVVKIWHPWEYGVYLCGGSMANSGSDRLKPIQIVYGCVEYIVLDVIYNTYWFRAEGDHFSVHYF